MDQVVLEIEEYGKTHAEFKTFGRGPIGIGRAFGNDLIINDPFVDALHLTLKCGEHGWQCEDKNSRNGTLISDSRGGKTRISDGQTCAVRSGDTITIGKTTIRVWDINQPADPAQVLDDTSGLVFLDPLKTAPSFWLSLGCFVFVYYLNLSQWFSRMNGAASAIVIGEAAVLLSLVLWSGSWALLTRFSRSRMAYTRPLLPVPASNCTRWSKASE